MRLPVRIVKPSGKDATDTRGTGRNKVGKWGSPLAESSGRLMRWGERGQMDHSWRS